MRKSITLGRWRLDIYEHAAYLQKQPDPKCAECRGAGHVEAGGLSVPGDLPDAEYEPCGCWDVDGGIRIPLVRRTPITERYPF